MTKLIFARGSLETAPEMAGLRSVVRSGAALGALALLSACGGGTGAAVPGGGAQPGGIVGNPSGSGSYQDANSTANVTSNLLGGALVARTGSGVIEISPVSGSINSATDATRIVDNNYVFFDPDGENASGSLTDGTGANAAVNTLSAGYNYSAFYIINYTASGAPTQADGAIGIATDPGDMPNSATATYQGDVLGGYVMGSTAVEFGGTASVTADFAAGRVDANISPTGFKTPFGAPVAGAIDNLQMNGMGISGNRFSGGTLSTSKSGSPVSLTGAGTVNSSSGAFFGYDAATGQPAEIGGAVGAAGASGSVGAVFIAK